MNNSQLDLLLQYIDLKVEHCGQVWGSAPGSSWHSEGQIKALKEKLRNELVDDKPESRG